ncbi:MAG: UDP-glucose 4-epimerase GalE [Candidatus Daviesbacteria bacterium]|nr:UDP-glucose 4-epimerase GalE [Candidatus Daviesbacteria bacterium]
MMTKKILVTGAGGYIGSITTDLLLQRGFNVVAVDNFSKGYKSPLVYLQNKYGKNKLIWYQKDLIKDNLEDIFKKEKIELIIHFAALCNVGESWDNPELYFGNNVVGLQKLAEAAIKAKVDKIIFSSTCAVYGDAKYLPIDEDHPLANPSSPYGATKKMCEEILNWYSKTGAMKYVFLRYFNVTGATADGSLGDSKNPSFHLIQNAVRGALGLAPFELNYASVNTPDGSPIRDYVNVVDLAEAHIKAADYLLKDDSESNIFNLGTGAGNSVLEIVSLVKEKTGVDFEVNPAKDRRKGEADKMIADITKIGKVLDWKPTHTLEQSIESLIKWYKKYPKGWNN